MCKDLNTTFAWIGAILINIGFLALISWGGSTLWPLGFVLSAIYTACLFFLAKWLQKRELQENHYYTEVDEVAIDNNRSSTTTTDNNHGNDNGVDTRSKISLPVNLLFGLSVLSFAGTGLFLPLNLIENCYGQYQPLPDHHHGQKTYRWTTDITLLPSPAVQRWAMAQQHDDPAYSSTIYSSFAYIASTKTTLFRGRADQTGPPTTSSSTTITIDDWLLFSVDATMNPRPKAHKEYLSPANFHVVSNTTICFTSTAKVAHGSSSSSSFNRPTKQRPRSSGGNTKEQIFCCRDEESNIRPAIGKPPLYDSGMVGNFFVDKNDNNNNNTGILWFMQFYEETASGHLVYSLDPTSMEILLYSQRVEDDHSNDDSGNNDDKDCRDTSRLQAIVILLVSVLPATLISIVAWYSQQIPSMAVTTYIGLYITFLLFYFIVTGDDNFDWNQSWLSITGLVWLLVLTYLSLSQSTREEQRGPIKWGLVVSGVAYFTGTTMLLQNHVGHGDTFTYWFVWNLLVVVPLLLLGIVTNNMFLVFFGGIGFLIDSVRFSTFVGSRVSDEAQGPVSFLVFAIAGLVAGALGFKLTQCQLYLENAARSIQESIQSRLFPHHAVLHEVDEPDDLATTLSLFVESPGE